MFVCSQLQHTYSAVFLLLVTAASDLLVHQIPLNSVLLSPIVSGGVRPKSHEQTPLGHNPPCLLPFVGLIGLGVRVSVSFLQKIPAGFCPTMSYGSRKRGYEQGGCVWGGDLPSAAYNVEPVTNTSSSSCTNNGRRTPRWVLGSTLAAVRRGFIFHTSRRVRLTTL